MAKLLKIGRILAFVCAALVYPAVWLISTQAVEDSHYSVYPSSSSAIPRSFAFAFET